MTRKVKKDLYKTIADTVITSLEQGTIPWEKPWHAAGLRDLPRSVSTGKAYSGINWFWLEMQRMIGGYSSPWWLTFKQAKKLGGTVRKGQQSAPCIFWKIIESEETQEDGKILRKGVPILRSFAVFNLDQCDLPEEAIERLAKRLDRLAPLAESNGDENETIQVADDCLRGFIDREGIGFDHGGNSAYYSPSEDRIQMPNLEAFKSSEAYYATLAHESVHATGHDSRLSRGFGKKAAFGSDDYGREELVAELGASMVLSVLDISKPEIEQNRDAYIANWIKAIKEDPRAITVAAGKAAKAADMILELDNEGDEDENE